MDDYPLEKPYSVAIPEAPVTMPRLPYVPRENDPLIDAGTARATPAPSTENPNGTAGGAWARDHQNRLYVLISLPQPQPRSRPFS
jgi:hypothetical protein